MKFTIRKLIALCLVTLSLAACGERQPSAIPTSAEFATDRWLGQWNGPEGTYLRLLGSNGKYEIVIQNLDGPRTYQGSAVGDQIQFERNGVTESIRATTGAATGMKWLADKTNCLTIVSGEGYCRD